MAKLSIYKYVRTDRGWRYCKAAFHPNGKIKPNVVLVCGVEEKHTEGRYFLNLNNRWIDGGTDALDAQRKRLLRLNQVEYERLSGRSLAAASVGQPSAVEFSGRKVIRDEVEAYLADLELTRRPARTVQSKRKYLGDFVRLIGKKFADEYRRERPGGSAIDARTTQHPGYAISQRKRKRVEECFGWLKTIALLRKVRHRGIFKVGWVFTFAAPAYNLVRMRNLMIQPA